MCACGGGKVRESEAGRAFLKSPSRLRSRRQTAAASPHEALDSATLIRAAAPTCEGKKQGRITGFS